MLSKLEIKKRAFIAAHPEARAVLHQALASNLIQTSDARASFVLNRLIPIIIEELYPYLEESIRREMSIDIETDMRT
jgi:hypothetical protein